MAGFLSQRNLAKVYLCSQKRMSTKSNITLLLVHSFSLPRILKARAQRLSSNEAIFPIKSTKRAACLATLLVIAIPLELVMFLHFRNGVFYYFYVIIKKMALFFFAYTFITSSPPSFFKTKWKEGQVSLFRFVWIYWGSRTSFY